MNKNRIELKNNLNNPEKKEKRSALNAFLYSLLAMTILLIILSRTIVTNPEDLGNIAFYNLVGLIAATLIAYNKKLSDSKILLLSIGIQIAAVIAGYLLINNNIIANT